MENKTLAERRKRMETSAYKKDLHHRNGIEGTLSGLVRGQKMRRSRYRGKEKNQLQMKMTGTAANILRLSTLRLRQNYEQKKPAA
jgi:IS5 family transposase